MADRLLWEKDVTRRRSDRGHGDRLLRRQLEGRKIAEKSMAWGRYMVLVGVLIIVLVNDLLTEILLA